MIEFKDFQILSRTFRQYNDTLELYFKHKRLGGGTTMYAFIVNPNSRSGLGLKIWEQLELILKERHIDYQIYFTRRPQITV